MAKGIRKEDRDYKKRFLNGFKILTRSRNMYEVWSDAMYLFATGIANPSILPLRELKPFDDVWNEREQEYLRVIKKYSKKEQKLFPQMFALLVEELEKNPNQDLLGEIYMMTGISNRDKGQFFTPYSVCRMMAGMNDAREQIQQKGWISVNDCACGAGALLIAFANECRKNGINYQTSVLFVAQDIDYITACMCYIQLSLLGCAGYVAVGDTLSHPGTSVDHRGLIPTPGQNVWYMPMYFRDVWHWRRAFSLITT